MDNRDASSIQIDPQTNAAKRVNNDLEKARLSSDSPNDLDKPFLKFSLADSNLDTSFCNNFKAVFLKKLHTYKRSKARLFCEVFLPSAFMIFGVWLSSIDWTFRSESRLLEPSLYPLKQKLLMNQEAYSS